MDDDVIDPKKRVSNDVMSYRKNKRDLVSILIIFFFLHFSIFVVKVECL
jgi:hypothetical protein